MAKSEQPTRRFSPRTVSAVCRRLESEYGRPRLGNPTDPIDDLVYVTLSNRTAPKVAEEVYRRIKSRFPSWSEVINGGERDLSDLLAPAGLNQIRGRYLLSALRQIKSDFGKVDISSLSERAPEDALHYLAGLPGISGKVARCVMMYTLGHKVLPVDVHVHRIAVRLGWTDRKRADQCHEELEALVPPDRRFAFHVDCIMHGREICRPKAPLCTRCCVRQFCEYYRRSEGETRATVRH